MVLADSVYIIYICISQFIGTTGVCIHTCTVHIHSTCTCICTCTLYRPVYTRFMHKFALPSIGDFNGKKFVNSNKCDQILWMDRGLDFYAPQIFSDAPKGRKIALGWFLRYIYMYIYIYVTIEHCTVLNINY